LDVAYTSPDLKMQEKTQWNPYGLDVSWPANLLIFAGTSINEAPDLMLVCLAAMPELLNAHGLPVASIFVLRSNTMFPDLHQNDMVIVDSNVPFGSLRIGDIIAFKTFGTTHAGQHEIIVHRVVQIVTDTHGDRILGAKGDNNSDSIPSLDYPIFEQNYIGKVVYVVNSNDTSALSGLLSNLGPSLLAR